MRHLIATACLSLPCSALAETWTVDDDGPADFDNIQAAVDAASDGDEIVVEPGVYTGTGDQVVDMLGKVITLRASGTAEETIVNGENARRGILCDSGETAETVIYGFAIVKGYDSYGGGIHCNGSNPTVANCTISGNTANDGGGGIYCTNSNATISNCMVTSNTSNYNGAIGCENSNIIITECTISTNNAPGIACGIGSNSIISNCTISHNTIGVNIGSSSSIIDCMIVGNTGGGIRCSSASNATITNCTVSYNTSSYEGAGISLAEGNIAEIRGCTITNNISSAYSGGGIYTNSYPWDYISNPLNPPVISDSVICGNTPNQMSGAWIDGGDVCLVTSCSDEDGDGVADECMMSGGAVHEVPREYQTIQDAVDASVNGDVVLVGPGKWHGDGTDVLDLRGKAITVRSTDGPDTTFIDGAHMRRGISFHSGETQSTVIDGFTVQNCHTAGNNESGWNSGSGILCMGASPTILNCIIQSNNSNNPGGGVSLYSSQAVIEHCVIANNNATYTGGVLVLGGQVQITDTQILNNVSSNGLGGGLYLYGAIPGGESAKLTLTDSSISHNTSLNDGGYYQGAGLLIYNGTLLAQNCSISNNIALYEKLTGGMGITSSGSNLQLLACDVSNNDSNGEPFFLRCGGGILTSALGSTQSCEIIVKNCTFKDNVTKSSAVGSSLFLVSDSSGSISNSQVCGSGPEPIYGDWIDGGGNTVTEECPDCPDINGDSEVGVFEILLVIAEWDTDDADADVNDDGIVDTNDLLFVLSAWGPCP